jgi:hypothetical protein
MAVLISQPALALVPGAAFLLLFGLVRRRVVLIAGCSWLLYAAYEYAMKLRWLCSGECNIRIDLLVIYPGLLLLSVVAGVVGLLALRRREPPDAGGDEPLT